MDKDYTDHQFSLFGHIKPKKKIPISKERIEEVKKLMESKDYTNAASKLRDIREKLEDYLDKL